MSSYKKIELQEFDGEEIRTPTAFVKAKLEETSGKMASTENLNQYKFLFGPMKPEMNSVYFILCDFMDTKKVQDSEESSTF